MIAVAMKIATAKIGKTKNKQIPNSFFHCPISVRSDKFGGFLVSCNRKFVTGLPELSDKKSKIFIHSMILGKSWSLLRDLDPQHYIISSIVLISV